jgi:tripartite-type tricarboxylate transporter receptor subunit TctC
MVHVPYHGSAPELVDLIAGHVQVAFEPIQSCLGYIKAGTLRALAVSTVARANALPDLPTLGEFIPGFEARTWQGLGAPKHLPTEMPQGQERDKLVETEGLIPLWEVRDV